MTIEPVLDFSALEIVKPSVPGKEMASDGRRTTSTKTLVTRMIRNGLILDYKQKPEQQISSHTSVADVFVVAHLGLVSIPAQSWRLMIEGMVSRPLTLDVVSLKRYPRHDIESVHKCAGDPLDPKMPTRQTANVRWTGADLRDVLADAGVTATATYLWAYGEDWGEFDDRAQPHYLKDVPMSRVREGGVLIAYAMNGADLSEAHGFPARLVVPGFYATNSVKWLKRLVVANTRADSIFTTELYNDPVPGGGTRPVWELPPESVIVAPADEATLSPGDVEIWGWAWSGTQLARVEVSSDGGASWQHTTLAPPNGSAWQRFSCLWSASRGVHHLMSRAVGTDGAVQPLAAARNAVYSLTVHVC